MAVNFSYFEAFSRNIGWVTQDEQAMLRHKRIAIAGLGGVGGSHLLTLTRLGIGAFHIADMDIFELANFNRQAGAMRSNLGRPKVEALAEQARDINPELDIKPFPQGVTPDNLTEFLDGVDVYVDGLDFFAFQARRMVFAACAERGIPAITAAPLGMGSALLNFLPGGMTFEQYFRLDGFPEAEQALRFMLGLAPAGLHLGYLVDPSRIDLAGRKGPSTGMACELCAGIAATQALKILLGRGKVLAAPHGLHYDAYRNRFSHTWRPGGNNNPIQRLGLSIARRRLAASAAGKAATQPPAAGGVIEQILELARWAPSGDNTQVWRFEIVDSQRFVVHGFDTRDHCLYDFNGHPSQIGLGALLENIAIAASGHGLMASFSRRADTPANKPTFDVALNPDPMLQIDALLPYIQARSVQRRPLQTRTLTIREKKALEASVGGGYRVLWLDGFATRLKMATLLFKNAKLRLTMPEAYAVHSSVIQWNARFSVDKVPAAAVGLDPLTTRLMGWVMQSWERVRFFNTFLAGTLMPRIQLDFIPGLACGAHFALLPSTPAQTVDDYVAAGRAMQRFWLTATQHNLRLQPEMTPLIFAWYVRTGTTFSQTEGIWEQAQRLRDNAAILLGPDELNRAVFMGRIGAGPAATARSLRLPLEQLLIQPGQGMP